jgi:1-acyl-sn-glycerol-3-phosphate acyltransferase
MIRGILYWIFGLILTFILILFVFIIFPFIRQDSKIPHRVSRVWSKAAFGFLCGVRLEIEGKANIDLSSNYIIVSNHRSYTDIFTATWAVPLDFLWLAKRSLFRIPLLGLAMKVCGYIPIERERSISASRSLDLTQAALLKGKSVWIFPEGTRTPKEQLGRFKRGAFVLAKETGIPILPVVLVNTDKIFLRPLVIRPNLVKVIVYPSVSYSEFKDRRTTDRDAMNRLIEKIRDTIQTGYDSNVS